MGILASAQSNADYAFSSWTMGGVILGIIAVVLVVVAIFNPVKKGRYAGLAVLAFFLALGTIVSHMHK